MSHNILIITYDMIPYAFTWGGCQRMYYLAQKLLSTGHSVDVFAMRVAKYDTYGRQLLPNVIFPEKAISKGNTGISEQITSNKNKGIKGLIRPIAFHIDSLLFNEITSGNGVVAYRKLRNARKKLETQITDKDYDIIIVSAPPFVVFSTIEIVKKIKPQIKVIMDYRDPWNSWHPGNLLCEYREKRLQRMADMIVCTNQALCDDMAHKYRINNNKYQVVENGYMSDEIEQNSNCGLNLSHDKMNIVYTGAISFSTTHDGYRDTIPLFTALNNLISTQYNDIRLIFVGEANSDKEYLSKLKKMLGDNLQIIGKVDNNIAKEYVRQADACLLLHTASDMSGKFLISGKAYDYIQAQKYIFSISRSDSQHAAILNEYEIGINVNNESFEIEKGLKDIYERWKKNGFEHTYNKVDIRRFSRDYQLEKYNTIIDQLLISNN